MAVAVVAAAAGPHVCMAGPPAEGLEDGYKKEKWEGLLNTV